MDQPVDPSRIPTPAAGPLEPEREGTLSRLHGALERDEITLAQFDERVELAMTASNRAELAVLTRDLTVPGRKSLPVPAATSRASIFAFLGGADRRGAWSVPGQLRVAAAMGGVELDFRRAELTAAVTEIRCFALMGGIDILVPPDLRVECHGTGIMGGFSSTGNPGAGVDGPTLRVTGVALMGGVTVRVRRRA
ncbi:MAG: DUF1707 domain-containing protein [Myxococcota bacterium]